MLQVQLSALNAPELKRLRDAARTRGQEGLARQLEAELAARARRLTGQPDPMTATPRPPLPLPPVRRRRGPAVAVAGLAAFAAAAVAWGLSLDAAPPPRPRPTVLAAAAPRLAVALTPQLPEEAALQPMQEPAAPAYVAAVRAKARARHNPCLDLPTAQERLVCGYPSLAIQDQRMRAALDQARANGSDPKAIDDAQAEWQAGSAEVSDRLALGERYASRITELEAE